MSKPALISALLVWSAIPGILPAEAADSPKTDKDLGNLVRIKPNVYRTAGYIIRTQNCHYHSPKPTND